MSDDPYKSAVVPHYLFTRQAMRANPKLLSLDSHLSDKERELLDQVFLSGGTATKPRSVLLLDNHSAHPHCGVRGAAYVYDPTALVGGSAPHSGRLFDHTVVLHIGDALDEAEIKAGMEGLAKKIRSVSRNPWRLGKHSPAVGINDSAPWEAAYGNNGNFVAVLREDKTYATPSYYLVAHTNAGPAGHDLYEALIKPGRITYEQLLNSPEYGRVKLYSQRNAKRILEAAASSLGVRHVTSEDVWASVDRELYEAYPRLAEPHIDTEFNTFSRLNVNGVDSVVFYSQSTPLQQECAGVAYLVDPLFGVILYKPRPDVVVGEPAWTNAAANAFPASTGHARAGESAQAKERLSLAKDRRNYALSIVQWEGRGKDPSANERLYKYAAFDQHTNGDVHREALGARYGHTHLKPVAVIVPPPCASSS